MTTILAQPNYLHRPPDCFREAVYEWIVHILSSFPEVKNVEFQKAYELRSSVLNGCVMAPMTRWTRALAGRLIEEGNEEFKERWAIYLVNEGES